MATSTQLKALVESHFDQDTDRFVTLALQMAAHEARLGHQTLANDIKDLVLKGKQFKSKVIRIKQDNADFIDFVYDKRHLSELIISPEMQLGIKRILNEYANKQKLAHYDLSFRRKILLVGPPGTGKTLTASVIASELNLPFYTVQIDKFITKFMGETSSRLRQIFESIKESTGVYLFDEFDSIGGDRNSDNEVGEMRRVLNSFLQFIERDQSESFIIAATNNASLLDNALFRRFDDILFYKLPDTTEILKLFANKLGMFYQKGKYAKALKAAENLSHAEISLACANAIKECVLTDQRIVSEDLLVILLTERRSAYNFLS